MINSFIIHNIQPDLGPNCLTLRCKLVGKYTQKNYWMILNSCDCITLRYSTKPNVPTFFTLSSQAKNLAFIFLLQPLPGHCPYVLIPTSDKFSQLYTHLSVIERDIFFIKIHRYGIPQPIWQQIWSKTLTLSSKLGVIPLTESQQWFWSQSFWNTNKNKVSF